METRLSNLKSKGREYLFKTVLVITPLFIDSLNSAFLFSIDRKSANKPTVSKNQGEFGSDAAAIPAIARNRKPEAIQKISNIGSFLSLKQ